ncbi:MAG: hypothetical protein ACRD50_14470 [Candidatus Acidiferrales bacterium]
MTKVFNFTVCAIRILIAATIFVLAGGLAFAGTLDGVVENRTTGKNAAGVDVILIQLQGGMQAVATVKADSQGRFHFDNPALGAAPMLIRVVYKGVKYHTPVPPGTPGVTVDIYEPTSDPKAIHISAHAIVLQSSGSALQVDEEYRIENTTQPPVAYSQPKGSFAFTLPANASQVQVSAAGSAGMPVVQGLIDLGKNTEAIDWAFRPGENQVQIVYQIPYSSNQATLQISSPYASDRVAIFVPPGMQASSDGFDPAGSTQGLSVFARRDVPANTPLNIAVSGTGALPQQDAQGGGAQGGAPPQGAESGGQVAQALPGRLDSVKWILVAGFVALFALGVAFLWKRAPEPAVAGAASGEVVPAPRPATTKRPAAPSSTSVAEVEREVQYSLDELKDTLFKLELRRQAGTVSEEEYARQRTRAEKILHDLVKG